MPSFRSISCIRKLLHERSGGFIKGGKSWRNVKKCKPKQEKICQKKFTQIWLRAQLHIRLNVTKYVPFEQWSIIIGCLKLYQTICIKGALKTVFLCSLLYTMSRLLLLNIQVLRFKVDASTLYCLDGSWS